MDSHSREYETWTHENKEGARDQSAMEGQNSMRGTGGLDGGGSMDTLGVLSCLRMPIGEKWRRT